MSFFRNDGYVWRQNGIHTGKVSNHASGLRSWYIIKDNLTAGIIKIKAIYFPKDMIGKKIRIKIEFVEFMETKKK